jgi:hypothetical protein
VRRRHGRCSTRKYERQGLEKKGREYEGRATHGFAEELGVGKGAAGDFLRRLKSGILRLTLVEGSEEEEGGAVECWRPRKRSESSEVLLRSLAEAVEGREGVAI